MDEGVSFSQAELNKLLGYTLTTEGGQKAPLCILEISEFLPKESVGDFFSLIRICVGRGRVEKCLMGACQPPSGKNDMDQQHVCQCVQTSVYLVYSVFLYV